MSISFSGLATGLDTSSWVESLVKIKQEKVSSYESTKKTLELTKEAVASIKSFFTSFRSVLEKVTDTKFGTAASDIFAQKLASSTNANLVSASATHEAEEAKYDVNVDKLATQTKANSGIKQLETITQIQTATLNTKLGDLGVKNGTIDVTVKGVKNNITISEENSIADFITKLKNVGVDSNFNEKTGVFSVDLPSGNIVDNGTGIIDAFHLQSSGYESTNLVTYTTSTVTSTATGNTKLSELDNGSILKSGTIQLEVNGTTHNISINKDETLSEFVNTLKTYGADAELADDGTLTIKDATITDIGNTKLLDVLGLHSDVSSKSQTAEGLKTTTIITTGIEATGATTLGELDGWKNISGTPQLVAVDAQGNTTTVEFTETSTLDEVVSALNNAGLKAELKNGTLSVTEGSVSGNVAELLGLTDKNIGRVSTTGKNLYTTMVTKATGDTKLADLGIDLTNPSHAPLIQIDPQANGYTISSSLNADTTINDYFAILKEHGINASISDGKITVEQNGHYDTGTIAQALGINHSTTTLVTANSASSTAQISYTITKTVDESTTFGEMGLAGLEYDIQNSAGNPVGGIFGHSVSSDTTFADFISELKKFGITLSLNNGVISLSTDSLNRIVTGALAEALGIQTASTSTGVTTGQSVTSTAALTYTTSVVATGSSKISDFVELSSNDSYNKIQIMITNFVGYNYTITSSTTFDELINKLQSHGIEATLSDGKLQINNTDGKHIQDYESSGGILSKLGITTTTISSSTTAESTVYTGSTLYYTTSVTVTSSNADNVYLKDVVGGFSSGETMVAYYDKSAMGTITVTNSMTVADLRQQLANLGLENVINSDGSITLNDISSNHRYVKGDFADRMGWTRGSSTTKGQAVTSGSSPYGYITRSAAMTSSDQIMATVTLTKTATLDSNISDTLSNWDSLNHTIYLRDSEGTIIDTQELSKYSDFTRLKVYGTSSQGSITVSMTNGILTLTQSCIDKDDVKNSTSNYLYWTGDVIDALGISATNTGVKSLTKTVGQAYTADAMSTSSGTANRYTKLTSLLPTNGDRALAVGDHWVVSWYRNKVYNYATFTVSSTDTIADYVTWLNNTTGIQSTFTADGTRIVYGGDDNAYFSYFSEVKDSSNNFYGSHAIRYFGLNNYGLNYNYINKTVTVTTKANTTSSTLNQRYTTTTVATTSTKLTDLGFTNGKTYNYTYWEMYDSVFKTANIAVTSDSTVKTILDSFGATGISASFSDGKFIFNEGSGYYMTSMDFANLINITPYSSNYYTKTYQTVVGGMTIGNAVSGLYTNDNIVSFSDGTSIKYTGSNMTFWDLQSALSKKGYTLSFDNGYLSIRSSSTSYITGFDSAFSRAFSIYAGEDKTYYKHLTNSDSYALNSSTTALVTGSTKLTDLGCSIGSFNIFDTTSLNSSGTSGYQYFTTTSDTTVDDFISWLESKGFSGSGISNGKITVGKNNNSYISWIGTTSNYDSFFQKLGLSTDTNEYYTGTTRYVYGNTNSNKQEKVTTYTADYDTTLGTLGLVGDGTIVIGGSKERTITVSASDTMTDLRNKLYITANISIDTTWNNSGEYVWEIKPNSDNYITSMSDNLKNVLKLAGVGNGYTYTVDGETTYENVTDGRTLTTTKTEHIHENTVIKNLDGYNHGNGTIKIKDYNDSSVDITITINQDGTLSDFFAQLRANGLTADVSNDGRVIIKDPDGGLHPVSVDGGSNILSRLLLVGESATTTIYNATTDGRTITDTQTVAVTGSTKLKDLFDENGNCISSKATYGTEGVARIISYNMQIATKDKNSNWTTTSVSLTLDSNINSILSAFEDAGINAKLQNGKIVLDSSSVADFDITCYAYGSRINYDPATYNFTSPLDVLFGDYKKTYDIASDLNTQTVTTAVTNATRDTLLKDLGVTSGEYYVYNNGVRYTALISDDETIGSFMDNLKSFGLQTGLMNTDDGAKLMIIGNGDSYIAKSNSTTNASNVVEKLFSNTTNTKYNYIGTENVTTTSTAAHEATKDTLLSEFDLSVPGPQGGQWLRNEGSLIFDIRGESKTISITSTDTFGSLINKLNDIGIASSFHDGKLYISDAYDIVHTGGTSQLLNILAKHTDSMSGFMASGDEVQETTNQIVEKDLSAANYADYNTVLGKLNIADGTFSIFRNGQKALIDIDSTKTFGDLRSQIAAKFSDVDLKFEDGKLVIYSKTDGVTVEAGTTTDTSNLQAVVGLVKDKSGMFSKSTRELYRVSTDTLVTAGGMFRLGDVTEGTFTVGNQEITVGKNTKLSDIINQINNSEAANATAYWDSIGGRLVIQSRTTGAALINIEAGTSNFTDIMGYTNSKWNSDGSLDETRLSVANQELGSNAKFTINGTKYSATSNTITSDITKIKGLTLNLKDITENNPVTITIEKDKDKVANTIESVVESYNELMKNVDEQISTTGKLHDQSTLKMIRNQLRTMMTGSDAGATVFRNLSAIGISVSSASANNTSTSNESIIDLSFDRDKFLEAYAKDADAVKALLVGGASNQGVFTKVENLLESSLKSVTGYFDVTEKSIKSDINKTAMKITKANEAIERYRAQLEKRFSSMNMMIAGMQQQYSSFLQS